VRVADVTAQWCCYALWGPAAQGILAALTAADLSHSAFPFMTSQEITVGDIPVRALQVTFVGEHGWELYTPSDYGQRLWSTVWEAGQSFGLVAGGYRAIESMRLEKGYRVWGSDLTPETTPYEARLGFCVKLDKPGGFEGREALLAQREQGLTRRFCALVLDDPTQVALGSEPIILGDRVVGRVTSGGYGYSVGSSIGYGYLAIDATEPGTRVAVDLFGNSVPATVVAEPVLQASP
jgi:4-methylaminobutanoate oxidase (formaldehyde-forming)